MATDGLPAEGIRFWRACILMFNAGTPVLRKLPVKKIHPYKDVDEFLQIPQHKHKLQRLKSKALPRVSLEKIYPSNNEKTNIETWDVTLLCVVLKEVCGLSPVEQDLVDEIRTMRNEKFAHNPKESLTETEFEQVWARTEAAIVGILDIINEADFTDAIRANIERYKKGDLLKADVDRARYAKETKWKEDIQYHLTDSQYNTYNTFLPVAPLYDDEGMNISKLYTDVYLYDDTRHGRASECRREDNQVTSYKEMLYWNKTGEQAKLILLKGPAGRGKSSFCLRMTNVWVSAVQKRRNGDVSFTEDETEMLNYDFVFFVALRYSSAESTFEMVKEQLFREAPAFANNLSKCFQTCTCLVILDGLDEWAAATQLPLPTTDSLYNCTRIISTRPWKLQAIPGTLNIRVFEIGIMDERAVRTLVTKIFDNHYKIPENNQPGMVNRFIHAMREYSLDSMAEIPLILTYLVCLWKDGTGLEESKTVNYGIILDSLMEYGHEGTLAKRSQKTLPGSLSSRTKCCKYSGLLYKLAQFAFDSVIGHEQPILVFKKAQVDAHFNETDELQFCLNTGLLSQSKAPGARANDNIITQFFHKSVQEFLVALYVAMSPLPNGMVKLKRQLKTINDVLALSNVLIFTCGLRPEFCNDLSNRIAEVVHESHEISRYRCSLEGLFAFRKSRSLTSYRTVKDVQTLVLECVQECKYNKRFPGTVTQKVNHSYGTMFTAAPPRLTPALRDFVIKDNSGDDVIALLKVNAKELRSLYIESSDRNAVRQITYQITNARKLQRLHLDKVSSGLIYDLDISKLNHLQSLSLALENISQFPKGLFAMVHLKAIALNISATHQVVEGFVVYFKNANNLEEVDIEMIRCVTHRGQQRCDLSLDVTGNRVLEKLSVQELSVKEAVLSQDADLKEVWLSGWMFNPSSVVRRLPSCRSLTTLILGDLIAVSCFEWTSDDIQKIAEVLPRLESLKHLQLIGISFREHRPVLSPNARLESISLEDVTLRDRSWIAFLRSLIDIPHRNTSGFISLRDDAYPIELIEQASREHFTNVSISKSRNRAIVKFDTNPTSASESRPDVAAECQCAIHQMDLDS